MLRALRSACEAIHFQVGSPLAKELTAAFQEVFEFRDAIKYDHVDPSKRVEHRCLQVYKFCKQTTFPKFIKIVKQHTGLHVEKVQFDPVMAVTGMFAVDLSMDDLEGAVVILDTYSGQDTYDSKTLDESVQEMRTMAEQLSLETGALKSYKYGKKREIKATMYFDVNAAFLPYDFLPHDLVGEEMNAAELAAIMIHEIGHVLTMVEHASDVYSRTQRITAHIEKLVKNQDPKKTVAQLLESGRPIIHEAIEKGTISKDFGERIERSLDGWKQIFEEETESFWLTLIALHIHIVQTYTLFTIHMVIQICFMPVIFRNGVQLMHEFQFVYKDKTSDQKKTSHNLYMVERLADEFASRHGVSGYLASGLNKIMHIMTLAGNSSIGISLSVRLRKSRIINMQVRILMFMMRYLVPSCGGHPAYEESLNRLQRLSQNIIAAFKNDLKPAELDFYLMDYERVQREIQICRGQSSIARNYKAICDYLDLFAIPAKLIAAVLSGRLGNDYEKLQNQMESLINNGLYYAGAKFRQLASRH